MTETEIRIAVAEERGWTRLEVYEGQVYGVEPGVTAPHSKAITPNWPKSLDACLEIVEAMYKDGWLFMLDYKLTIDGSVPVWQAYFHDPSPDEPRSAEVASATTAPLAICKAFLRHKGRWKE